MLEKYVSDTPPLLRSAMDRWLKLRDEDGKNTRKKLADKSDLSENTIERAFTSGQMTLETARRVCMAINVDYDFCYEERKYVSSEDNIDYLVKKADDLLYQREYDASYYFIQEALKDIKNREKDVKPDTQIKIAK